MSWKPEVRTGVEWNQNSLVFATKEEAEENARNLFNRWMVCTGSRAVESTKPVNYKWENEQLIPVSNDEN